MIPDRVQNSHEELLSEDVRIPQQVKEGRDTTLEGKKHQEAI